MLMESWMDLEVILMRDKPSFKLEKLEVDFLKTLIESNPYRVSRM